MTIEMSLDYYQDGFGSVLDFFDLIYYKDAPYLFGWACLVKLDNGSYGVTRIAKDGTEFDSPSPTFNTYDAAVGYWEYYRQKRLTSQRSDEQEFLRGHLARIY